MVDAILQKKITIWTIFLNYLYDGCHERKLGWYQKSMTNMKCGHTAFKGFTADADPRVVSEVGPS